MAGSATGNLWEYICKNKDKIEWEREIQEERGEEDKMKEREKHPKASKVNEKNNNTTKKEKTDEGVTKDTRYL